MSTGERPLTDIFQDRRFWLIHTVALSSLFVAGVFAVAFGLASLVFFRVREGHGELANAGLRPGRLLTVTDRFLGLGSAW